MDKDKLMKTGKSGSLILQTKMLILFLGEDKKLTILGMGAEIIQIDLISPLCFPCTAID